MRNLAYPFMIKSYRFATEPLTTQRSHNSSDDYMCLRIERRIGGETRQTAKCPGRSRLRSLACCLSNKERSVY